MKIWIFFFLLASSTTFAATSFKLSKEKGSTGFLAIGNPSAIRIEGKSPGPEGDLAIQEKGESLFVSGQLKVSMKECDTGIALRDRHMKEKYLEVEKFENATLTINELAVPKVALSKETETKVPFSGVLELHGVKKNVTGEFAVKNPLEGLKMTATFQLKLSDYGIQVPSFAGITVADQVEIKAASHIERF